MNISGNIKSVSNINTQVSGTSIVFDKDYDKLNNKPKINGVELEGDLSSEDIHIEAKVKDVLVNNLSVLDSEGIAHVVVPSDLSYFGVESSVEELNYSKGVISPIQPQINSKQDTLVSGTNIKTVNGQSILGSGDLSAGLVDDVKVNGSSVVSNKIANVSVPTKTSDLTNDSDFTTKTYVDEQLVTKQNVINDLESIRSNASAGKTAKDTIDTYGNIVTHNINEFATAAQGAKADTAVQPAAIADMATKTYVDGKIEDEADIRSAVDIALDERIDNLESIGRYLSTWNCTTGLPGTNPTTSPYSYKTGDYFVVSGVGTTNYKPNGSQYIIGQASTTVESDEVSVGDFYIYDSTNWKLLYNTKKTTTFSSIAGSPYDNTNLSTSLNAKADETDLTAHTSNTNNPHSVTKTQVGLDNVDNTSDLDKPISTATQSALDLKQNNLTAGTNITIVNDVISSTAQDNSFRGSWSNWANVPSNSSQYPADKHGSTTPVDGDFLIVNDASDLPGTTYSITMKITSKYNFSLTYYQGSDIVEVETNPIASGAITYKLNNKIYYTYRYSNSIYFYANTDLVYNGVTYHANEVMFSHWAGTTGTKNWTFSEPANPYSGTWRLSYSGIWSSLGKGGWTPQYQVEKILPVASPTQLGITKLYTSTGSAIDGTIDQNTITAQLGAKSSVSVSDTGTSADVVNYITIDGVEKKLPTGGSGGLVDDVKVNGTSVVENKIANVNVPVNLSDLTDDSSTYPIDKADTLTDLTATVNELNYVDGVTSNIQTQLDGKQSTIDSSNKLSSDLVDDTNNTNKFVTTSEKTAIGTALQPNDNISELNNDAGYTTKELYECTYGTTTFAQVTQALSDGKLPYVAYSNNLFWWLSLSGGKYWFTTTYLNSVYVINVTSSNVWSVEIKTNQDASMRVTSISSSSSDTQYPSAKCVYDNLELKQDTLVSGTNIKTINNQSILGSGNISILSPSIGYTEI